MKRVCIILTICALVRAQIPNLGFCPDYLPMPEFDMERFLGKWYEAERYFQFTEVASRCVVTDYAKAPSGRIYVTNEVTNRLTGIKRVIDGNLELVGKIGEGKLHVKYSTTPLPTENSLVVLDTDYDSYAVVWSCNGFGPIHAQSAWVMTRDRLPSGVVLQRAYGVLDKFKISRTFFVKTDQEGCAVAASEINAANGITAESTVAHATGSEQKNLIHEKSAGVEEPVLSKEPEKAVPVSEYIKKSEVKVEQPLKKAEKEEIKDEKQVEKKEEKIEEKKEEKKDEKKEVKKEVKKEEKKEDKKEEKPSKN